MITPKHDNRVQSFKYWVIRDIPKAILNLSPASHSMPISCTANILTKSILKLIDGIPPLLLQCLQLVIKLRKCVPLHFHNWPLSNDLFELRVKVFGNALSQIKGSFQRVLILLVVVKGSNST